MTFSTFNDFLAWERASRDTIDFKRVYVDLAEGDILAGLTLSELVYWYLPSKDGGVSKLRVEFQGEMWRAIRLYEWWDRARLTPEQARRAIGLLKDLGVVATTLHKFKGEPTTHIRIVEDVFLAKLEACIASPKENPFSPGGERYSGGAKPPKNDVSVNENAPNVVSQPKPDWATTQNGMGHSPSPVTQTTTQTTTKTEEDESGKAPDSPPSTPILPFQGKDRIESWGADNPQEIHVPGNGVKANPDYSERCSECNEPITQDMDECGNCRHAVAWSGSTIAAKRAKRRQAAAADARAKEKRESITANMSETAAFLLHTARATSLNGEAYYAKGEMGRLDSFVAALGKDNVVQIVKSAQAGGTKGRGLIVHVLRALAVDADPSLKGQTHAADYRGKLRTSKSQSARLSPEEFAKSWGQ
jgi:hypothetical protein